MRPPILKRAFAYNKADGATDGAATHMPAGKIGNKNCDPCDAGRGHAENKHP